MFMLVKVYLEDDELLKFLAGQPCEGYFVSYAENHRDCEVMVPREKVEAVERNAIFGPRLRARVTP